MPDPLSIVMFACGLASAVAAALYSGRARGQVAEAQAQTKTADIWKGETEAVRARANRLQDENAQLTAALREATARTDITQVMTLIGDSMKTAAEMQERTLNRVADHFENHERGATERHQATVEAFSHLNDSLAAVTRTLTSQAQATERRNGSG